MRRARHGDRGRLGVGHDGAARLHLERAAAQARVRRDAARIDPHGVLRVRAVGDVRRQHLRGQLRRLGGLGLLLVAADEAAAARTRWASAGSTRCGRASAPARPRRTRRRSGESPTHPTLSVSPLTTAATAVVASTQPARRASASTAVSQLARKAAMAGDASPALESRRAWRSFSLARRAPRQPPRARRRGREDARHRDRALRRHDVRVLHGRALALHPEGRRRVRRRLLAGAAAAQLLRGAPLLDSSRSFLARLKSRPAATTTTRPASVPAAKARSHGNQPAGGGASTGAAGADRPRRASAPPTRLRFLIMAAKMAWICLEPKSCSALARRVQRAGSEVSALVC